MAHNWKAVAKRGGITVAEVGVIGTSIVLTKKFLDARELFKDHIAKDATFADKWYIKHQGAIKLGVGAIAATMIKNPWLKMLCIGVAIEGFITEARVLTTNKETGVSFFQQIGTTGLDEEMLQAAAAINGGNDQVALNDWQTASVAGFGNDFGTMVAGQGFGSDYGTMVAGTGYDD